MNFNFGAQKAPGSVTLTATSTAPTSTVNFGSGDNKSIAAQPSAKAPSYGLSFSTPATAPPSTGFTLGTAPTTAPNPAFGTPSSAPAPNFSLGAPANTTAAAKTSALGGFTLNASTAVTSIPTLGAGATTGLELGTPATGAPAGFYLGVNARSASQTSAGLSFGTGLNLGSTTTTPAATGLSLGKPVSTASTAAPLLSTSTTTLATPLAGTATTPATPAPGGLNFNQIEEVLNKWTLELEEQGKVFINQALQLNAWDRLVISNGEKILTLNNGIEKVKQQQQQLDHELEFVLIQQRELEECITPLEKELKDIPIADHDRNHTYQMAENMDTQLKQMSEDLKEIIEHLNESNKSEDTSDPVSQIGRILNAHMNSLQWIDRNTAQISTLLDQITKMHDMHRRDNERSFHLTYE